MCLRQLIPDRYLGLSPVPFSAFPTVGIWPKWRFLDVVRHEFLPNGRTVNKDICMLCAICAMKSARIARICGRTKIGFCTKITSLITHRYLCAMF
ncbi:hypothetical protein J6590_005071 [Homalodisca vitripennis]|nr:hypothetical protein J6590_005071 [Homalodisca vitripennis]